MFCTQDVALAGAIAHDPVAAMVLCHPFRPQRVFVAGREVVRDGHLVALDEAALAAQLNDLVQSRLGR
jgi:NaMN:DMB phosphoribosyltransferase